MASEIRAEGRFLIIIPDVSFNLPFNLAINFFPLSRSSAATVATPEKLNRVSAIYQPACTHVHGNQPLGTEDYPIACARERPNATPKWGMTGGARRVQLAVVADGDGADGTRRERREP